MSDVLCMNPERDRHTIAKGERRIDITPLAVDWGATDVRPSWQGTYTFCCFECLAAWASERAADHDGRVVSEGEKPKGDES